MVWYPIDATVSDVTVLLKPGPLVEEVWVFQLTTSAFPAGDVWERVFDQVPDIYDAAERQLVLSRPPAGLWSFVQLQPVSFADAVMRPARVGRLAMTETVSWWTEPEGAGESGHRRGFLSSPGGSAVEFSEAQVTHELDRVASTAYEIEPLGAATTPGRIAIRGSSVLIY